MNLVWLKYIMIHFFNYHFYYTCYTSYYLKKYAINFIILLFYLILYMTLSKKLISILYRTFKKKLNLNFYYFIIIFNAKRDTIWGKKIWFRIAIFIMNEFIVNKFFYDVLSLYNLRKHTIQNLLKKTFDFVYNAICSH